MLRVLHIHIEEWAGGELEEGDRGARGAELEKGGERERRGGGVNQHFGGIYFY